MFSLHNGNTKVERDEDGSVNFILINGMTVKFTAGEWCSLVTLLRQRMRIQQRHMKP